MAKKLTVRERMLRSFRTGKDYQDIEAYFETGEFTNEEIVEFSLSTYFAKQNVKAHRSAGKTAVVIGVARWILGQDITGPERERIVEVVKLFADYGVHNLVYTLNSYNTYWKDNKNVEKNTPARNFGIGTYWQYRDKSQMCLEEARLYYDECLRDNVNIEEATDALFNILEPGVKRRNKDCIHEMSMLKWRSERNEIPEVTMERYRPLADYLNSRVMVKNLSGNQASFF